MEKVGTANRAYAAVAIAIVSVSFASIFIRWSASSPLAIATYRMGFASLLLAPLVLAGPRRHLASLPSRELVWMFLTGFVLATHFAFWISSLAMTTVASSVILVNAHPLLVAFISHYIFKERLSRLQVFGVVLGFCGVLTIASGDYGVGNESLVGDLYALVGGVMAGIYIAAGRRIRQTVPLLPYAFIVYSISTVALIAVSLALNVDLTPISDPAKELALFLALAVVSTIFGHTMYNWTLKFLPAHIVSLSLIGEPIGASILALLFLQEVPTIPLFAGGAIAVIGIYLAARSRPSAVKVPLME